MEPVTLVLIGAAAYSYFKGKGAVISKAELPSQAPTSNDLPILAGPTGQPLSTGASGTGPDAPLATNTGLANPITILDSQPPAVQVVPIPPLALVLDNATAIALRQYALLDPDGFRIFLDRYADYFVLRSDQFIEMLTDPPAAGFQATPGMIANMGIAAYKVVQGLNGVAAGQYGDIFGVAATTAGQIPMINPDLLKSLQGLALGYRAYTAAMTVGDIASIAAANGVGMMDVTSSMLAGGGVSGSMAMAPIASFAGVLMAVGLCVDIAFTIIGDRPDVQKAVDIALDAASLVCLFIPIVGWVVAIVIQLIKFIIDCFGEQIFGGGMTKTQHDMIEAAKYGEQLSPMWPILADSLTPRELWLHIVQWGSGYCGGAHTVAVAVWINLKAGDVIVIAGKLVTIDQDRMLNFGTQGCYWLRGTIFESMTNDEQALALATFGATDGRIGAQAQVGIMESMKSQFNIPTVNIIQARCAPMANFVKHGVTLDGMDQIVAEFRAQVPLNNLAKMFKYETWQTMIGTVLASEWTTWAGSTPHGSLHDFAVSLHQPTMYALRAVAFQSYQVIFDRVGNLNARLDSVIAFVNQYITAGPRVFPANMVPGQYYAEYTVPPGAIMQTAQQTVDPALLAKLNDLDARLKATEAVIAQFANALQVAYQQQQAIASMPSL